MRLEHEKGSLHASHARQAFLRALRAHLPPETFAELDAIPNKPELVEAWADAHGINAPCVVEEFGCYCAGGWSKLGHLSGGGWNSPTIPLEWRQAVGKFNQRPLDPWAWSGVYADDFLMQEASRGRSVPGVAPDVVEKAFDRHLGPIATDPSRESWEEFQARARSHWTARVRMAKTFGFRPAGKESEWPNLHRDLQWLIRHQVNRETFDEIAGFQTREDAVDPEGVKKAVDRLCRTIGLKRKRRRRPASTRPGPMK